MSAVVVYVHESQIGRACFAHDSEKSATGLLGSLPDALAHGVRGMLVLS